MLFYSIHELLVYAILSLKSTVRVPTGAAHFLLNIGLPTKHNSYNTQRHSVQVKCKDKSYLAV